ncbi:MAG TPA: Hsp70 family protein [Polyangiaceae bacterium]|nr:Hsp70 family protein [Polyangiaceae bacterium]
MSRYVVGIDLGTTHSALAYAELAGGANAPGAAPRIEVLDIAQLVAPATVDARPLLPSFHYSPHASEGPMALPWDATRAHAVGELARARGAEAPQRVVASAKSWLCHAGVDRRAAILPHGAPDDVEKVSPVEASFRILEHLSDAWNHAIAKGDPALALGAQDVVLTVPASFDAAARELTVEAAYAAGLEHVTLLEEPQAALYAWLAARGDAWRSDIVVGDVVLVCDVGGGTTDFSAICATERDGALELVRVAVGDHILLGGDNMDLALAHVAAQKLTAGGREIDRWQSTQLAHAARAAKEALLGDDSMQSAPIVIAGRGSRLVGGALRTELDRAELERTLVEGFFPLVPASARPAVRARVGLRQLGLPYAQDAAVTRHLAAFLGRQAGAAERVAGASAGAITGAGRPLLCPTVVLFNGGVMKAEPLRARVRGCLATWLSECGAKPARELGGTDLDLAVAKGAAAYGLTRHGAGLRIRGGTARAYYVGIEGSAPAVPGVEPPLTALCVAPFGVEEGSPPVELPVELGAVVGEKVSFRFFGSSTRRDDRAGAELDVVPSAGLTELSPVEIELPSEGRAPGDVVPVRLAASVTEVGTLLVEAVPLSPRKPGERWKVELGVRDDATEVIDAGWS